MADKYTLNDLENEIVEMYNDIHLGKDENEICHNCKIQNEKLNNPVGMWCVGKNWKKNKIKILFVGKNAVGDGNDDIESSFSDPEVMKIDEKGNRFFSCKFAFWDYTREISKRIFGDESCENIAVTNMVKCNDASSTKVFKDTTIKEAKDYCIDELKVIREEIKIIEPTHIVFYTNTDYDYYIFDKKSLFDFIEKKDFSGYVSSQPFKVKVGSMPMWYREAEAKIENNNINVLRLGHPQCKTKEDFVNLVVNWINKTSK